MGSSWSLLCVDRPVWRAADVCSPLLVSCMRQRNVRTQGRVRGTNLGAPSMLATTGRPAGHDAPGPGVITGACCRRCRSYPAGTREEAPPPLYGMVVPMGLCVYVCPQVYVHADVHVGAWVG